MIRNYFKTALRNILKNRLFSFINVLGLSSAIAVCTLVFLYVKSETGFDKFHSKADRIYRVITREQDNNGYDRTSAASPLVMGGALADSHEEIEAFSRIYTSSQVVKLGDRDINRELIAYVDNAFFRMFDFPVAQGSERDLLANRNSVVIHRELAEKYFGTRDAIGKTLEIELGDGFHPFEVTGILDDFIDHSSMVFDMVIPVENMEPLIGKRGFTNWFFSASETYFLMAEDFNRKQFEENTFATIESGLGEAAEDTDISIWLQPLHDVHLNSLYTGAIAQTGDKQLLYILVGVALIILAIAIINSTTLAVGMASGRSREVGVRKVTGAGRNQLIKQFMIDASIITSVALILGLLTASILLPSFNQWFSTNLSFEFNIFSVLVLLTFFVFIAFLSGFYPSLILSSYKPAVILKSQVGVKGGKNYFRKSLLIVQFSMFLFLLVCTIVMYAQMNFIAGKNLGFSKDFVMNIPVQTRAVGGGFSNYVDSSFHKAGLLKSGLKKLADVKQVTRAVQSFETTTWMRGGFNAHDGQMKFFTFNVIDADFIETMDLKMEIGRDFNVESESDKNRAVVVNESFVKYYQLENPLGMPLPGPDYTETEIIGVVKDFHYESLKNEIKPLVLAVDARVIFQGIKDLSMDTDTAPDVIVKLSPGNISDRIEKVKAVYSEVYPSELFEFSFIDQTVKEIYQKETSLRKMITTVAMVAIFIAMIGLMALIALVMSKKTKEVGIRKVLGASIGSVVILLSKEFMLLFIFGLLFALPLSHFFISDWLGNFYYKIDLNWSIYALAGLAGVIITACTVGGQTIRAALMNPVNSLRNE